MTTSTSRTSAVARIAAAVALLLAVAAMAGCGSSSSSTTAAPTGTTAKAAWAVAKSTLSTAAPDGKLLVAQTVMPVTTTGTPQWEFLVGSPKTDVVWAVVVQNGKGQFQQYSQAGLSKDDWAKVPTDADWKIDSDVALTNALKVYPNGKGFSYVPGFVTYIPASAVTSDTVKQMKWIINFDPTSQKNATTSTVEVDLKTGEAQLAK